MGENPIEWAWSRGWEVEGRIQIGEKNVEFFVQAKAMNSEESDPFLSNHFILSQHFSSMTSLVFIVIYLSYKNSD